MIKPAQGNLLAAEAEALVNTVNTEGVMGKGIALQFKQAYPEMNRAYQKACAAGEVRLGEMHVHDLGGLIGGPRWIINFPTKGHWRSRSRLADVESGLLDLKAKVSALSIRSIAVPPLGCGNGGLDWNQVRPLIEATFADLPDVHVQLFAPTGAPEAAAMPIRTKRPKMTIGQAALVALMDRYLKGLLDPFVSLLEVHKLMYFLKAAGEPMPRLPFTANRYGPYAKDLRHGLVRMEGHLTRGFGEGTDNPRLPLELLPGAVEAADAFLADRSETKTRMEAVAQLIEGYEDPYGMELLSSVHWVMQHESGARESAQKAITAVHDWNDRKKHLLKPDHLEKAWVRLKTNRWDHSTTTE
ncbi:type II toxin-antitoxin system antitoxin DNA ADP-ribosyl glycohydrolase DarG [Synoicihabitans lomoniglobus]|uniref:Macro domain-containing protein n=1 Tax=Synoicihabitans lomoniglobus TaxID=2909285 RepID=A0AAE9ZX87_9BACT|nr:macro domain-containing protein [Opitutaceae bacterium LMO-M01]WED64585.1 macro domain-containing protein [Opitutaceae bacterium LMO-M01]